MSDILERLAGQTIGVCLNREAAAEITALRAEFARLQQELAETQALEMNHEGACVRLTKEVERLKGEVDKVRDAERKRIITLLKAREEVEQGTAVRCDEADPFGLQGYKAGGSEADAHWCRVVLLRELIAALVLAPEGEKKELPKDMFRGDKDYYEHHERKEDLQ